MPVATRPHFNFKLDRKLGVHGCLASRAQFALSQKCVGFFEHFYLRLSPTAADHVVGNQKAILDQQNLLIVDPAHQPGVRNHGLGGSSSRKTSTAGSSLSACRIRDSSAALALPVSERRISLPGSFVAVTVKAASGVRRQLSIGSGEADVVILILVRLELVK
jgi:hypothetical protein